MVPNLLLVREDGTGTSANGIRNQLLTHADSMSDKDCKVIGGSSKENGADKVHNKGCLGKSLRPKCPLLLDYRNERGASFRSTDDPKEDIPEQWGKVLSTESIGSGVQEARGWQSSDPCKRCHSRDFPRRL